jgi:hypothetical protein
MRPLFVAADAETLTIVPSSVTLLEVLVVPYRARNQLVAILGRQITTAEIAEAAGMSPSSIRQARLQEGAPGYRTPPKRLKSALIALAEARKKELKELLHALRS